MANRLPMLFLWAQDGERQDPDTDTDHPMFVPDRYTIGWELRDPVLGEKEPLEWVNFFYYNLELNYRDHAALLNPWSPAVSYKKGAFVSTSTPETYWIAEQANKGIDPTTDNGANWTVSELLAYTYNEMQQFLTEMSDRVNAHITRKDNPHDVTAEQINAYVESAFDALIVTLQGNVNTHKNNKSNPHVITHTQLGVLPVAGGTFTGVVGMREMHMPNTGKILLDTVGFQLVRGNDAYAIKDGVASFNGTELVSYQNFTRIKRKNGTLFEVPPPDFALDLSIDLNTRTDTRTTGYVVQYVRNSVLNYTNKSGVASVAQVDEPAFDANGLLIPVVRGALYIESDIMNTVGTIFATLDGVPSIFTGVDLSTITDFISFFSGVTRIRDLKIWNYELTSKQISALGVL